MKPQENLTNLFNEFNNLSSDQNNNSGNISNCKYYDIDEIQTLHKLNNKQTLSLFHINSCSLSKNIENFEYLLNSTSINFDVMAISETRIVKGKIPVNTLNLINYSHEFCFTVSLAGSTLFYIRNQLSYEPRNDLCIYKATELKSSFIEISIFKRCNIIIGCIYRHPNMDLDEFNDNYLNILLDKLSKKNKCVFLLGDFNIDLSKYNKHAPTNESWTQFLHIHFSHISTNQL